MSTCWSLGRAAWLPSTPELPNAGLAFGGFMACAGRWGGGGLSGAALTAAALVTVYFPFCLQPVMWHGSCAGEAV